MQLPQPTSFSFLCVHCTGWAGPQAFGRALVRCLLWRPQGSYLPAGSSGASSAAGIQNLKHFGDTFVHMDSRSGGREKNNVLLTSCPWGDWNSCATAAKASGVGRWGTAATAEARVIGGWISGWGSAGTVQIEDKNCSSSNSGEIKTSLFLTLR